VKIGELENFCLTCQEFFKTSPLFFVAHFLHIVLFYFAAWGTLWYFGNNWITWLAAAALTTVSQVSIICNIILRDTLAVDNFAEATKMYGSDLGCFW
jgi:Kef-type K+ transport system membrane component KefB